MGSGFEKSAVSPTPPHVFFWNSPYFNPLRNVGETGANSASGHVRYIAIFSMQIKMWSWETYLDFTGGKCVCMSIQELRF